MRLRLLACVPGLLLAACTIEPRYQRPTLPLPDTWRADPAAVDATVAQDLWWRGFGDPQLLALFATAQRNSADLQIAIDHVMIARDMVTVARSHRYPSVGLIGQPSDPVTNQLRLATANQVQVNNNIFALSFDASYEFDFWGRIRNLMRSAKAGYRASVADAGTVLIGLRSTIADAYFGIRELDERAALETQRGELAAQRLRLAQLRQQAGRTGAEPVDEAQRALSESDARLSDLRRQRELGIVTLALLLGVNPEDFQLAPAPLRSTTQLQAPPEGLPARLLHQRPDIVAAEQHLRAAHADVAIQHAELLPQVVLTAKFGYVTGAVRNLAEAGSTVYGVGPEIGFPIFDAGLRKAQLDATRWQRDASFNEYRKTVQVAFADVERALLSYQAAAEAAQRSAAEVERANAQQQRSESALAAGRSSRLESLAAQDGALLAQLESLQAYRAQLSSLVSLYQALGGGWHPDAVPLPEQLPPVPTQAAAPG